MTIGIHSQAVVFKSDPADLIPGDHQLFPLGTEIVYPRAGSPETWVYVFRTDQGVHQAIAGSILATDETLSPLIPFHVSTFGGPWTNSVGVTQNTVNGGEYAFILKRGVGVVLYQAGVTATKGRSFWANSWAADENLAHSTTGPGGLGYNLETKTDVNIFTVAAWINCLG